MNSRIYSSPLALNLFFIWPKGHTFFLPSYHTIFFGNKIKSKKSELSYLFKSGRLQLYNLKKKNVKRKIPSKKCLRDMIFHGKNLLYIGIIMHIITQSNFENYLHCVYRYSDFLYKSAENGSMSVH